MAFIVIARYRVNNHFNGEHFHSIDCFDRDNKYHVLHFDCIDKKQIVT
jgi:hypothetical protein